MCRLTSSIFNSRQIGNEGKCRCECKKDLIDKGICNKGFIWNPSNCGWDCDKSRGIGEYLDYKKCVCRNSIVDKLIEECTNVIDENKIYNETLNAIPSDDCASCTLYVVLLAVFLTTSVIIGAVFVYFYWYSKKYIVRQYLKKHNVSATQFYVTYTMVATKQLNIKNRIYYFYNDLISLKDFDPNILKLDKTSFNDISMYYIGYVTKKPQYNINTANPLYLLIAELDGFIEEKEEDKYLNIGLTNSNSEVLKKYAEI